MKEILKKLIAEGWDLKPVHIKRGLVPRELAAKKHSLAIIGPRRAGKSYTIYEHMDAVGSRDFIYLNFEDERLPEFKKEHFDLILEAYFEMREGNPALFLDEIESIGGWERFARRLADSGYKTVVSGSNSRVLGREIAQKLGGRFAKVEVFPLSFAEFVKFKGMEFKPEFFYSKERFDIKRHFEEYFRHGGFPEVALLSDAESKKKVLDSYFDLVFYKDLIARRGLENEGVLRFMIKKVRENIGRVAAPRAIYSALKEAQISVGPNTVEKYLEYLEEAFLTVPCLPFAKSVVRQERKKRYFIDNGYVSAFEVKEDRGILLENLVFLELLKMGKAVCYHQGKKECDFIVGGSLAIQVTYELSDANFGRETEGLLEALSAYDIKEALIITYDQEKEVEAGGKKIRVLPAWKWCLAQS